MTDNEAIKDEMSMIEQQVKELREHGQIHKHNNRYTVDLLNQAADTIEALSAKLVTVTPKRPLEYEEHEDYDEGICPICGEPVCHVYAYCPGCGQHLKWGSDTEESKTANMEHSGRYYGDGWILCEKKMPEKTRRYYIVSVKNEVSDLEYTRPALYDNSGFAIKITEKVIAWQPLPEPYRGGDTSEK